MYSNDSLRTLDLRQVEVFYYVAKFRSFSKAAEALLLTQPTISGHIKALEESLTLVLFDRLGRAQEVEAANIVIAAPLSGLCSDGGREGFGMQPSDAVAEEFGIPRKHFDVANLDHALISIGLLHHVAGLSHTAHVHARYVFADHS